ncbi:MAG: efflux RND transporter permease subunit [Spirochaetes bacterium]|nr:efflux RND transporter permease subunit [Spirochaetota bacterium]
MLKIPDFSIKHPVIVIIITIAVAFMGITSLANLKTDLFPDVNLPTIAVVTIYQGVGPKDVEEDLTIPLENAFSELSGVEKIDSSSMEGVSLIVVSFAWGKDLSEATVELREAVNRIADQLPDESEIPLMIKYDPSQLAICTMTLSGQLSPNEIRKLLDENVLNRLQRIDGVAQIDVYGGDVEIIEVAIHLAQLEARGISIIEVLERFRYENVNFPAGNIVIKQKDFILRAVGEFKTLDDIGNMVIGFKDNAFIFLKDVATVHFTNKGERDAAFDPNGYCVYLEVLKQSGKNTIEVIEKIKSEINQIEKNYNYKLEFNFISDQSKQINQSINSVVRSAYQGGFLAVLFLFLFLGNYRTTIFISISIPMSIIATFFLMRYFELSFNLMTMGGLTLGIGMLVDNSIVILENIFRHFSNGMPRLEAASYGANEVSSAIIASTITTIAVFAPLITVEGIAGLMFRDIAKTVTFSLSMSILTALTLIPLFSSRFLKHTYMLTEDGKKNKLFAFVEKVLEYLDKLYSYLTSVALKHRIMVFTLFGGLFLASIILIAVLGFEFLPPMDQGEILVNLELPMGTPLDKTKKVTMEIGKFLNTQEEIDNYLGMYGFGGSEQFGGFGAGTNYGYFNIRLKDKRKHDIWELMEIIRNYIKDHHAGVKVIMAAGGLGSYVTLATGGGADIQINIKGSDIDTLRSVALMIQDELEKIQGTRDIRLSVNFGLPEMQFKIDSRQANTLGLSTYEVALTTRAAFNGIEVSKYRVKDEEAKIWVRLAEDDRNDPASIEKLFLKNQQGSIIPLSSVSDLVEGNSPTKIKRLNKERIISVLSNVSDRNANEIVIDLNERINKLKIPGEVSIEAAGTNKEMKTSFKSLFLALMTAIFLVYVVMAIQFESFIHPLIVLFSIPFSLIGVVLSILIFQISFSVLSYLGLIMLAGIVVNNAIVLIDYIHIQRKEGQGLQVAILTATRTRLRPILMTTLTTVFALIPMAISTAKGGELLKPLGIVVIGGLSTATLVTLVLIPTIYYTIESFKLNIINNSKKGE